MKLEDFYNKPASEQLTKEEIAFIKSQIPKKRYRAKYAIYKKESPKGTPLAFIIDSSPGCPRKSGYLVQYEVIYQRELSNIEYHEVIENFGTNNRRFKEYLYQNVDQMIHEDAKYNVETPKRFIDECRHRGYSGDFQLKMFDSY